MDGTHHPFLDRQLFFLCAATSWTSLNANFLHRADVNPRGGGSGATPAVSQPPPDLRSLTRWKVGRRGLEGRMGLPAACGRIHSDGYGRRGRCVDLKGPSDPEIGNGSDDGSDHGSG